MVAVSPPAKVLVTCANGYFATWVVKKYLEAGYSVRGTVRSLSKGAFLIDEFAHYGDSFELVVVEDIIKEGAFDEAIKGVDIIAYTASPFHHKSTNPDGMPYFIRILILFVAQVTDTDLIIPAVRGTTSILNSALRHGNSLKRFILTSSIATVREDTTAPHFFTESNWNDSAVERVKTKGSAAGSATIHMASKTLIEKIAWKFIAAHRTEISWDLVVINPPLIFGASLFFCSLLSCS
jgi:nucleoside-diphosphate-sugar epimerase